MSNRDVRATSPQLLVEVTPLNQHGSIENSGRNEVLDCENESGPSEVVEKRTAFVFKALQCVGLIGGERSRKFGRLFALLVSVTMWLPPISLAVCVSKNPTMSSFSQRSADSASVPWPSTLTSFQCSLRFQKSRTIAKEYLLGFSASELLPDVCNRDSRIWDSNVTVSCLACVSLCHATHSSRAMASNYGCLLFRSHLLRVGKRGDKSDV